MREEGYHKETSVSSSPYKYGNLKVSNGFGVGKSWRRDISVTFFADITDYVIPENRKSNKHFVNRGKSGSPG